MQFSSYFQFRRSSFTFIFVNDVSSIQFSSTFTFVDASFVLLARKILSMQSFTVHLVPISTFMENTCSNSTSTTSTARRTQQQATNVHFFLQQPQTTKTNSPIFIIFSPTIKIKLQVALLLASFKQYPIIERI